MRYSKAPGALVFALMCAGMGPISLAHAAQAPTIEEFPWLENTVGMDHGVPAPWTTVTVNGQTIGVWGRTIQFKNSFLPTQITSQDVPMLAGPMRLDITAAGKPLVFERVVTRFVSRRDDQVVLETGGFAGRLGCKTTTTIEFDGMVKINVLLTPQNVADIDGCRIVIPIANEVAKVFARFLQYDFVKMRTDKMDIVNAVKELDGSPIHVEFMPEVSLFNRRVGLTWNAETNAQWDYSDPKKALSVIPGKNSTDLIMNIIDHPVGLDRTKTVEFALFPTPLKPFDPRLRQIRMAAGGRFLTAFKAGASRTTYDNYAIHFPGEFAPLYDGLPIVNGNPIYVKCRERDQRDNLKFIPYGALWYGNAVHPAGRKFYPDWHLEPVGKTQQGQWKRYDEGETKDLNKSRAGHWDGYRVCAWPKSYADFLVHTYSEAIRNENIDGIYFDHGEVVISCRNPNHRHIVAPTGAQPHVYFGVFSNRELLKRLWIAAKRLKPEIIITQHQSHLSKGIDSFMDIVTTGEIHNVIFAGSPSSDEIRKNPALYVPDYDKIPRALLDYDNLECYGFDSRLIPGIKYVIPEHWDKHPAEFKFYSDKMYRYCLLNGTRMWDGNMDQRSINEAWKAMDTMGRWTPNMVFHGWWDNSGKIKTANATTKVSYYSRPGRVLLILANESKKDVQETVSLTLWEKLTRAVDAVSGEPVTREGNVIRATVPAELYRAILLGE